MKSRTIAVVMIVTSLLVVAANGQDKSGNTVKTIAEIVLQDDDSGNYLTLNLSTGEYKFRACAWNTDIGGSLKVSFAGLNVSARYVSDTQMILVDVDLFSGKGRAYILVEGAGEGSATREFTITDSNIKDSIAECKPVGK